MRSNNNRKERQQGVTCYSVQTVGNKIKAIRFNDMYDGFLRETFQSSDEFCSRYCFKVNLEECWHREFGDMLKELPTSHWHY